jgi:hypothetical protein
LLTEDLTGRCGDRRDLSERGPDFGAREGAFARLCGSEPKKRVFARGFKVLGPAETGRKGVLSAILHAHEVIFQLTESIDSGIKAAMSV